MPDEIPYFDRLYYGFTFADALALKEEIERDPCYHVSGLSERPFPYNQGKWVLSVWFQHRLDGKRRYGQFGMRVASREDWERMQEGARQRVATQDEKIKQKKLKTPKASEPQ